MAISKLNVINLAVILTGAEKLTSLTSSSKAAKLANEFFEISYRAMAELPYDWYFLTTRAELAEMSDVRDAQDFGSWEYVFVLPSDCLRVIARIDEDDDETEYDYRQEVWTDENNNEKEVLLTNESECYIKYIKNRGVKPEAISRWPGWFVRIVALDLAILLAEPLKQDKVKKNQLINLMLDPVSGWLAKAVAANGMIGVTTNDDAVDQDDGTTDVLDASVSDELTKKYIQTRD